MYCNEHRVGLTSRGVFVPVRTVWDFIQFCLVQVATLEGSPQICLGEQPTSGEQLLLAIMECCYKLAAAVRTKVVSSLNLLFEKHFSDDAVMMVCFYCSVAREVLHKPTYCVVIFFPTELKPLIQAHTALMRWSYPSATVWDQYAASEKQSAEQPLPERDCSKGKAVCPLA